MLNDSIHIKIFLKANVDKLAAAIERGTRASLDRLSNAIENLWRVKAQEELKNTSDVYMKGVKVRVDNGAIRIDLEGWLPVALETGAEKFDLKPGFLGNRQSRVIPFGNNVYRTVSQTSPKDSWWHPGLGARAIREKVVTALTRVAGEIFSAEFERLSI